MGTTPATATRDLWPARILAGGIVLTALVAGTLAHLALGQREQRLESAASQAQAAIVTRVDTSVALLRGTAGLFASHAEDVTVETFHEYVERLALRDRYPGLLAIGFARVLAPGEEERVARDLQRQGIAGFRVWPPAGGQALRTAITYIEPLDERNRAALGYDMATHAVRRAAMQRARDTGAVTASGMVELVQEIADEKQPGFLLYAPVYARGAVPATQEERREKLRGFAYSPIRAVDFLSSAFAHEAVPSVALAVFHGRRADPSRELYRRGAPPEQADFPVKRTVEVAGETWTFAFASRDPLADALLLPAITVLVGIALSGLLAELVRRERHAHALAQRALEAERVARAEAERANTAKDQFLATLSHELRTPLHAIIGWTSLLRMPQIDEEKRRQGIDVVDRNARTQARLIEDLLDMHRIAAGKVTLEMQVVGLAAVVQDALRALRPVVDRKRIALEVVLPDAPLAVRGDPARLLQVVSNLVSNAAKFTPEGGSVAVRLARDGDIARITIVDTGPGIDPALCEVIFDRFAQADSSSARRHGGLGLGLAIVRQLVRLHGGTVRAESRGLGHGSTFTVELPALPAGALEDAATAPLPAVGSLKGLRVLAVDDEPDSRSFVKTALSGMGATVEVAASADEALERFRESVPDLLLSDIGMPGKDGHALIREIRAMPALRGGRVPAVAITAYARAVDRDSALDSGFDAYLTKPLRADELLMAVSSLATRRRAA